MGFTMNFKNKEAFFTDTAHYDSETIMPLEDWLKILNIGFIEFILLDNFEIV